MLENRHILDVKKQQIEKNLFGLFEQVRHAIEGAINCLGGKDMDVCQTVIDEDAQINAARRLLEQDCLVVIASQQPVAHDLREIVAFMRIATELERIGDYASDIAVSVMQMDGGDLSALGLDEVVAMSRDCIEMLSKVGAAVSGRDTEKARQTSKMDDRVDQAQQDLVEKLFADMQSDPTQVPDASRMLWICHNLERCGDRATNIAEQVVFMMDAEVVELD